MVGDEQVGAGVTGLRDDREGRVDGRVDAPHGLLRVTGHQADAVPGLRRVLGVEPLEDRQHVAQSDGGHVGPAGLEPTTPAV